jgi:two-component system, NtrC family, sensor kinase
MKVYYLIFYLDLSLSYDIVKAHAGEIKVEMKEGVGTKFIIQLPV